MNLTAQNTPTIAFEISSLNMRGISEIHSTAQRARKQYKYIFFLSSGPIIWFYKAEVRFRGLLTNIVMGFREKLIRPTGGGKKGEWLGSALPIPTGLDSASSPGVTLRLILTFPTYKPLLSMVWT